MGGQATTAAAASGLGQQSQAWNYAPPQAGVTAPYNPSAQSAMDLKGPLSKFALSMAAQQLAQKGGGMATPQHVMGMNPNQPPPRSPYGMNSLPYQARPLGRLS